MESFSEERLAEEIIDARLRKVMFVGAVDTGKTHLALSLADRLREVGLPTGLLDFDPGQSTVGPPGCLGLQFPWASGADALFPTAMAFLGFVSPAFDVGAVIEAGLRLEGLAWELGCRTLLIDTSGMVEGHLAAFLKRSKIRALRPDLVVLLERESEASHVFRGLEGGALGRLLRLSPHPEARRRSREERASYRRLRVLQYFREAVEVELDLAGRDVTGSSRRVRPGIFALEEGTLLGLNDGRGLTTAMGRFLEEDGKKLRVATPLRGGGEGIRGISVGPSLLDGEGNIRWRREYRGY